MTKQLTVHNAEVRTAAVEVRSLTISGKQVTLAVFRQLQEEDPLSDDGEWKGIPWGFVNYLNDDPKNRFHVVWQRGTELRRGFIDKRIPNWYDLDGSAWISALVDTGWRSEYWISTYQRWVDRSGEVKNFYWSGERSRAFGRGFDARLSIDYGDWYAEGDYDPETSKCLQIPDPAATSGRYTTHDRVKIHHDLVKQAEQQEMYRAARRKRWQETLALDQLFIAV